MVADVTEVHLKSDQIKSFYMEVTVKPRGWRSRLLGKHTRRLKRVQPIDEIIEWLEENVKHKKKWRFHQSTKSIVFRDQDDAFHFRMRW